MLEAKQFRTIARNALKGKWAVAIGTGFVAGLLGGTINHGGSYTLNRVSENAVSDFIKWLETNMDTAMFPWILGLLVFIALYLLVTLFIGGAVSFGYSIFNLNLVDGKQVEFKDLFSQIRRIGAGFTMVILQTIYIILWLLLLIVPGIIATYRYAMTPYIMAEHPDYGANQAITYSKELMIGNKWRLFCLHLSFIGWQLLCILTLGIGFLWLIPYKEAATAAFYRDITGTANFEDTYFIED